MLTNPNFKELLNLFKKNNCKYLIVGGYAVMKYTEPRFTKDLDILVAIDETNAKSVYHALKEFALLVGGGPGKEGKSAVQVAAGHGIFAGPAQPASPFTQRLAGTTPPGSGSKGEIAGRQALPNDLRRLTPADIILALGDVEKINKVNVDCPEQNPFFRKMLTGDQVRGLYAQGVLNFADANLNGANLSGAKLSEADLSRADLSGADLRGATGVTNSSLKHAKIDKDTRLP